LPISATDVFHPAFEHAREQLFTQFRFGQWVRLAIVGLLAGEMGGCSVNLNFPSGSFHWPGHERNAPHTANAFLPAAWTAHPLLFAAAIAVAVLIGLALFVLLIYIQSVMRFILFDSVIARECHIRAGWTRRHRPGFHLFIWQLAFTAATYVVMLVVIAGPALSVWALGWFARPRDHLLGLILAGLALLAILLVLVFAALVIQLMTKDFVVPQMALEDVSAFEGWRRLWLWLKHDAGGYAGYVGMKIVLAIGAAIACAILAVIAILILAVPIGIATWVVVRRAEAAGWAWNAHTIALAVVAGLIALGIVFFVAAMISVPVVVFFPAYSIYFFAPRYAQLAELLWPAPPLSISSPPA
jgi:hypothetical protein